MIAHAWKAKCCMVYHETCLEITSSPSPYYTECCSLSPDLHGDFLKCPNPLLSLSVPHPDSRLTRIKINKGKQKSQYTNANWGPSKAASLCSELKDSLLSICPVWTVSHQLFYHIPWLWKLSCYSSEIKAIFSGSSPCSSLLQLSCFFLSGAGGHY